ncbi:MAG: AAA family ATPase, partial [Clostridia bacterium]
MSFTLLLFLLLFGGMIFFVRRKKSERGFVGSIEHHSEGTVPSVRFTDIAANEEALESLHDILSFIRLPEQYSRFGARTPRGVLLYGLPGTGKTLMARALAGEAGVPFFAVNGADFVEMYVGVGASRIRALFKSARKKRDNRSDEREQTLNALLSEMSGFREGDGVVVLAATNRVDTLDEALLRAGRFDRHIEVPLPGYDERVKILEVHARNKPLGADVSLPELAAQTALFSGAKLEGVLNEAAIFAAKRNAERIESEDVNRAINFMLFGMDRRGNSALAKEREITAAHEAGHALLTAILLPESSIKKVSIIPTGHGAAGYSMAIPPEKMFHQKQELLHHIAVALAGREAETILLGAEGVSTGAANDIEKAATLAQRMVCEWGMLPGNDGVYLFAQSQKDFAAQQWLRNGQHLAATVLRRYQSAWERLTQLLLERETLGQSEVLDCIVEDGRDSNPSFCNSSPEGGAGGIAEMAFRGTGVGGGPPTRGMDFGRA